MAFEDLDLEFEDEEEAKKKKRDDLPVDVDLEFTNAAIKVPPRAPGARPGASPQAVASAPAGQPAQSSTVRPLQRPGGPAPARPAPARPANAAPAPAPRLIGATALKDDLDDVESMEVVEMREKMRKTEFEADVRVAIAEYKVEHLSELLSDIKLMDHQINQLLVRINAKHPDLKQEVLMIKKILADFTSKKRK
jgi:hypothetical protein